MNLYEAFDKVKISTVTKTNPPYLCIFSNKTSEIVRPVLGLPLFLQEYTDEDLKEAHGMGMTIPYQEEEREVFKQWLLKNGVEIDGTPEDQLKFVWSMYTKMHRETLGEYDGWFYS